jgi:ATP-binding cassette, subfamily B, bacterial PglK
MRNVTGEVGMFTSEIAQAKYLLTEALVLLCLCTLLLVVEPLGVLIVVLVLGAAVGGGGLRIQHLKRGLGGAKDVKLLGREAALLE